MTKRAVGIWAIIVAPIAAFYGLLASETVNIPFMDDYGGCLGFVSNWIQLPTFREKLLFILTSQANEYKIVFCHALYVLQYLIFGHINFAVLSTVGNLFVLPLYIVLFRMWAADSPRNDLHVSLFIPVSWVLFQLQYYSLLSWPASTLQNIPVLFFSLLTIYLVSKDTQRTFILSLISLAFAIASSGNGFFVVPLGCLMLIQFRRPARIAVLVGASSAILALYLYRYNFNSSQAHADHSVLSSLHHISPIYALSFLGASIARYGSYVPAAILGAGICGVFAYAIYDKFYDRNPAIFYSMCFILITAFAVSGLRSDLGIAQSLVSRYRIYSNLMLILIYLYAVGKLQTAGKGDQNNLDKPARLPLVATVVVVAILFNIGSNYAGFKLLHGRTELTKQGMSRFELNQQSITEIAGPSNEDPVIRRQRLSGNYEPQAKFLHQAELLNVYSPPGYLMTNP
jgi:hypothetical protein